MEPQGTELDKSGRAPRLALRQDDPKAGEGAKAYPAGKRLTPTEVKRSIAHAPVCPKSKKPICWDAACHIGCTRTDCPHAHELLPSLSKLDFSVAMQVLRRGGLRNGANAAKVNPKDVDGRVAQLRAQAKEEQESKMEPGAARGKAKAKTKAKAGWSVPEDYQGPVTQMEAELGDLRRTPWLQPMTQPIQRHRSVRPSINDCWRKEP